LHAYYDQDEKLYLVELFEPAAVTFKSIPLLDNDLEKVKQDLERAGAAQCKVDNGLEYEDLGFVLVVGDGQIEGVSVFGNRPFGSFARLGEPDPVDTRA
jgi:hypothetical protein